MYLKKLKCFRCLLVSTNEHNSKQLQRSCLLTLQQPDVPILTAAAACYTTASLIRRDLQGFHRQRPAEHGIVERVDLRSRLQGATTPTAFIHPSGRGSHSLRPAGGHQGCFSTASGGTSSTRTELHHGQLRTEKMPLERQPVRQSRWLL